VDDGARAVGDGEGGGLGSQLAKWSKFEDPNSELRLDRNEGSPLVLITRLLFSSVPNIPQRQ